MRVVIPGGTGQIGGFLARWFRAGGDEVLIVGRSVADPALRWDARSDGPWFEAIDGADLVINMTGRTVNCRYHWSNLNEMMRSRIDSCLAVGRAIAAAKHPPIPNREFMAVLREAAGAPFGLPVWPGIAELGAIFLQTDVELMRKSRCVAPGKLLDAGYRFTHADWRDAAPQLIERWRRGDVLGAGPDRPASGAPGR